jgi:hypothetical protein
LGKLEGVKMSNNITVTDLERTSLEAHVDLCAIRYANLDTRLTAVEQKLDKMHVNIKEGNASMIKVLIGTAGTIIAGLLSTIVVILINVG